MEVKSGITKKKPGHINFKPFPTFYCETYPKIQNI